MTCPLGKNSYIKKIEQIFYHFVWDNKPDKIKRIIITQNYCNGGLKMINLEQFVKALKCTWIRRLINAKNNQWSTLFESQCCTIRKICDLGPQGSQDQISKAKNPFWNEVFETWECVYKSFNINAAIAPYTPVWYNSKIKKGLYKDSWYRHGITCVGDLMDFNTQKIRTKEQIENLFNFKIKNFLDYFEVRDTLKRFLDKTYTQDTVFEKPFIPNHLYFLTRFNKGCKIIYNILKDQPCDNKYRTQWRRELNLTIDNLTWKRIFHICVNTIKDNKLIYFQYKIIHKILGTNKLLNQIGKSNNNRCRLCGEDIETIDHLFVTCKVTKILWHDLNDWLKIKINKEIDLSPMRIIMGHLETDNNFLPINTIILVTKYYIFTSAVKTCLPSFHELKWIIKRCYNEQHWLSQEQNKETYFNKSWLIFKEIF